jgi:beta-lactamase superfamily II metal-dependent hydrolase
MHAMYLSDVYSDFGPHSAVAEPRLAPARPYSALAGEMHLRIWDVEHGACAMIRHFNAGMWGRLAMIDSGDAADFRPSTFIRHSLNLTRLDYLFITNADQDHMSDLAGLTAGGIHVPVMFRNPSYTGGQLRGIKEKGGNALTPDAQWYVNACEIYSHGYPDDPFDQYMGGVSAEVFYNPYPTFTDTNNLSLVAAIRFGTFQILFPGDLTREGWLALLAREDFRRMLSATTILVASHHGRDDGYCEEVFNYCRPRAVVMSDKAIVHDTQRTTGIYGSRVTDHFRDGVLIANTGNYRNILTTRKDGHIHFTVLDNGDFRIDTENGD